MFTILKLVFNFVFLLADLGKTNGSIYKSTTLNEKDATGWGPGPFSNVDLAPYFNLFDRSWYLHVNSLLDEVNSGAEEDRLLNDCQNVAVSCYLLLFVQG